MFRRPAPELELTREEWNGLIELIMRIDANILWLRAELEEEGDGEEEE